MHSCVGHNRCRVRSAPIRKNRWFGIWGFCNQFPFAVLSASFRAIFNPNLTNWTIGLSGHLSWRSSPVTNKLRLTLGSHTSSIARVSRRWLDRDSRPWPYIMYPGLSKAVWHCPGIHWIPKGSIYVKAGFWICTTCSWKWMFVESPWNLRGWPVEMVPVGRL